MKGRKRFLTIWLISIFAIAIITAIFKKDVTKFYGIASAEEVMINYEKPVKVKKINVMSGQRVNKGDLLFELIRPSLAIEVSNLQHEIEQLKGKVRGETLEILSEIKELKAIKEAKIQEINSEIEEIKNSYQYNRKLSSELKSITIDEESDEDSDSPMNKKITSLSKELELATNPLDIKISQLESELNNSDDPRSIQLDRLNNELDLLLKEQQELKITSSFDCIVSDVKFKIGENISPFEPIITLHSLNPTYVKGYIHENLYKQIKIDDEVVIEPLSSNGKSFKAKVLSLGSKIVEFPSRLVKREEIKVYGVEVVLQLLDNDLLLGEKVLILSNSSQSLFDKLVEYYNSLMES
ncbi:MAG: HlyD family efflux transporter periplasmic adaptor subunit [Candidatus Delongbacteria bacterium]|nr:HlyD family efflux transporter periplasmic adaptor subunit [Candidatus Delongbacteria bacterium]MBN2833565.1 HlyD family efflux transporter periplasmic adaptor subunit [Candidatus Delongbacteria bacterium]